jgi:hypothetical protein
MNKSTPIYLEAQLATFSPGVDHHDARRQFTISLWLVGLLSLAMLAVMTAQPQLSGRGPAVGLSNPAQSIASGPATALIR